MLRPEAFDLRDVTDVAEDVSDDLPQTDEVHEFLQFIDAVANLDD